MGIIYADDVADRQRFQGAARPKIFEDSVFFAV